MTRCRRVGRSDRAWHSSDVESLRSLETRKCTKRGKPPWGNNNGVFGILDEPEVCNKPGSVEVTTAIAGLLLIDLFRPPPLIAVVAILERWEFSSVTPLLKRTRPNPVKELPPPLL
mmetsp:Transcript_54446/g.101788  ORF Transcript_54446/g.101788 Transcript_54446/m.101788 type:complete len:116 (-) Transcript_54446:393-740(-)